MLTATVDLNVYKYTQPINRVGDVKYTSSVNII